MAKKKKESEADQLERFEKAVQEMVDAGELSPTDAEAAMDRLVRQSPTISSDTGER